MVVMTVAIPGSSDGWRVPGRHEDRSLLLTSPSRLCKDALCVCVYVCACMLAVKHKDRICVCISFKDVCNTLKVYIGNQITRLINFNELATHLQRDNISLLIFWYIFNRPFTFWFLIVLGSSLNGTSSF